MVGGSSQAKPSHRDRELSLMPLLVGEACPKDARQGFALQQVKLQEELGKGQGVDGSQEETNLWQTETGAQQDKFKMRVLDVGQQLSYLSDLCHFRLQSFFHKFLISDRGTKEGDT